MKIIGNFLLRRLRKKQNLQKTNSKTFALGGGEPTTNSPNVLIKKVILIGTTENSLDLFAAQKKMLALGFETTTVFFCKNLDFPPEDLNPPWHIFTPSHINFTGLVSSKHTKEILTKSYDICIYFSVFFNLSAFYLLHQINSSYKISKFVDYKYNDVFDLSISLPEKNFSQIFLKEILSFFKIE